MERVLGGADKIILDSNTQSGSGVVPYLPLPGLTPQNQQNQPPQQTQSQTRTRAGGSR
jgi:hypothetical protein